jgi:hypothetical protein
MKRVELASSGRNFTSGKVKGADVTCELRTISGAISWGGYDLNSNKHRKRSTGVHR